MAHKFALAAAVLAVALAAVLALALAALWLGMPGTGLVPLGESQKVIAIGAVLPLTTENAYIGDDWREGMELAVEEFNAKNPLNPIKLFYEDSQSDPKTAVTAFNKLKDVQGITVFVTTLSSVTLALAPIAEKNKTPLFTVATAPSVLNAGEYTFVNNFSGEQEMGFFVDFVASELKYKKLAVIAQNSDVGVEYAGLLQKKFPEKGGAVVAVEFFENKAVDYRTQLAKVKESAPDFIFVVGYAPHISRILLQAKELGIKQPFFSYWAAHEKKLIEDAKGAAEGLVFTSSSFSENDAPEFFKKYAEKFGRPPHYRAGLAFDIIGMLAQSIGACNYDTENTECIKEKIYGIKDYPGITGLTTITKEGGAVKELAVWKAEGGKFLPYKN